MLFFPSFFFFLMQYSFVGFNVLFILHVWHHTDVCLVLGLAFPPLNIMTFTLFSTGMYKVTVVITLFFF